MGGRVGRSDGGWGGRRWRGRTSDCKELLAIIIIRVITVSVRFFVCILLCNIRHTFEKSIFVQNSALFGKVGSDEFHREYNLVYEAETLICWIAREHRWKSTYQWTVNVTAILSSFSGRASEGHRQRLRPARLRPIRPWDSHRNCKEFLSISENRQFKNFRKIWSFCV